MSLDNARRATAQRATSHASYRTKGGMLVNAYWLPEGGIEVWYNNGPPPVHEVISEDDLEYAVATGQLRDPLQKGLGD